MAALDRDCPKETTVTKGSCVKKLFITLLAALPSLALADLGDSKAMSAQKYSPLNHDSSFDVVGKDGKPHPVDDFYTYYSHGDWVISQAYNAKGIAVVAMYYKASGDSLTQAEVEAILRRNRLPSFNVAGWTKLNDLDQWLAPDGRHFAMIEKFIVGGKDVIGHLGVGTIEGWKLLQAA